MSQFYRVVPSTYRQCPVLTPNAASLCSRMPRTSLTGPWQDLVRSVGLTISCGSSFTSYHLQIKQRSQKDRGPAVHWFTRECFYDLKRLTFPENVLTAGMSTEYSDSDHLPISMSSRVVGASFYLVSDSRKSPYMCLLHTFVFIHITSHPLRNKAPNRAKRRTQKEKNERW